MTVPYAAQISRNARAATRDASVPDLRLERPPVIEPAADVTFADNHKDAAREACQLGEALFLTIGTRNLAPYVKEADRTGVDI